MTLSVNANGRAVLQVLQRMNVALRGQMRPIFQAMGAALEQNANLRFDLKEAPDGSPWAAWAPSTAAARAASGRGTLLEYTGRMRASLTHLADNNGVEVGFGVPYAKYVDVARPLLLTNSGLSQQDTDDALRAAMAAFRRILPQVTP